MKLSTFCINRPVFTIVINLLILILGFMGWQRLEVRELPRIDKPQVSVQTEYPGASAATIETSVTTLIEGRLAGIEGIDTLVSTSRDSFSEILVNFDAGSDVSEGINTIRDRVSGILNQLPEDAKMPQVIKADVDAEPVVYISVNDATRPLTEISDFIHRNLLAQFEQLPGVAYVNLYGDRRVAMKINLNPERLAAYGVTVNDVNNAIRNQNQDLPTGGLTSQNRFLTIVSQSKLSSVEEFKNLIIYDSSDYIVRLSDVADVELAAQSDSVKNRIDGKENIVMAVVPQSVANPVVVSDAAQALVAQVAGTLPQGMQIETVYDVANFIRASIHEVFETLIIAVILVIGVVVALLGNVRTALIPIITIPFCLIGTFGIMAVMGYSINTLTLLALVLAVGLVVDDAIVVVENVHRHIEQGLKPFAAAIKAVKEIGFAIIAMTITLAAVYAPVGFQQGSVGILFREFAFSLAAAVIISGFVALTLSPMLAARLLKKSTEENRYSQWLEKVLNKITSSYKRLLTSVLQARSSIYLVFGILLVAGVFFIRALPQELVPQEDAGVIFTPIGAPSGSTADYTDKWARKIEDLFATVPEKANYLAIVGYPREAKGFAILVLKPWDERDATQEEIRMRLMMPVLNLPGINAFPISPPPIGFGSSGNVDFVIKYSGEYVELAELMERLVANAKQFPGFANVESSLKFDKPELKLDINRELAASLGVSLTAIGETLSTALEGRKVTTFSYGGESYDVVVRTEEEQRRDSRILERLFVANKDQDMVPLTTILAFEQTTGTEELSRWGRQRSATLSAKLKPGYTLDDAMDFLTSMAQKSFPEQATYDFSGEVREFIKASGEMKITLTLAILFIFLVLAAQFESFIDPLAIMLTVPVSIVGALLFLLLSAGTNNIYSQIGIVTLIGLITKHGILITEFANQLVAAGKDVTSAVIEAAAIRLRPIIMTTLAMVLGALPLSFAFGPGAQSRQDIGWVIVGGMLLGTIFSLFVVPTAYILLKSRQKPQRLPEEN